MVSAFLRTTTDQDAVTSSFLTIPGPLKGPEDMLHPAHRGARGGLGPLPSAGRPATRRGLAVQVEAGRGQRRLLVPQSCKLETTGRSSSSSGKGSPSACLAGSNGFQGREGHVQGFVTIITCAPALGQGRPGSGASSGAGGSPLEHASPLPPPLRDERERRCNTV